MEDKLPLVLQTEILCRLPLKSLIRFRSVSKRWKSYIHSSDFNSDCIVRQSQRKRLLITNCFFNKKRNLTAAADDNYCLLVDDDDDTFPHHKVRLNYPLSVNLLKNVNDLKFLGSSHGLLCFSGCHVGEDDTFIRCVIWNPLLRKSVAIDTIYYDSLFVGFGVCPKFIDPKIVKINTYNVPCDFSVWRVTKRRVWRVEIFTLSSGVWRSPLIKPPIDLFKYHLNEDTRLVINGFIYWHAWCERSRSMIISFDLTSEEFTKIQFTSNKLCSCRFDMVKLRESLGVVRRKIKGSQEVYKVWLMDHVSKSFFKLFTVNMPKFSIRTLLGFRDSSQLILIGTSCNSKDLVAYETHSNHLKNIGIYVDYYSPSLTSYTESLLLLDQSDTLNDNESDANIASFGDRES